MLLVFSSKPLTFFQCTFYIAFCRLSLQVLTLIVIVFAACQGQFQFSLAVLEIHFKRHQRITLFPGLAEEFDDFRLVHQQFSGAKRVMIEDISLLIRADMHMFNEYLVILDNGITVLEICLASPQGLDLSPLQCQPRLKSLMNEIVMTGLAVLTGNLDRDVLLTQ